MVLVPVSNTASGPDLGTVASQKGADIKGSLLMDLWRQVAGVKVSPSLSGACLCQADPDRALGQEYASPINTHGLVS